LEPEIVKEFGLINLTLIKTFNCNKIPEVLIIDNHFDKVFYSLEFWLLFFEHFNDCQKFFIVNLIIIFGRNIFNWKESDKIKSLFRIILREYTSRNPIRNVRFNNRSPIKIEKSEDKDNSKNRFQIVEHL